MAVSVSVYYPHPLVMRYTDETGYHPSAPHLYPYYMPMVYYPLNLVQVRDQEMTEPQPEPIVVGLPNEENFVCPGDGLFPDPNSGCKAYFNCQGEQVRKYNPMKINLNYPFLFHLVLEIHLPSIFEV